MTVFNPSNPATSGIEWLPTRRLPKTLSNAAGTGVKVTAISSETIKEIHAFLLLTGTVPKLTAVDVYDLTATPDPESVVLTRGLLRPVADTSHGSGWDQYKSGIIVSPYGTNNKVVTGSISGTTLTLTVNTLIPEDVNRPLTGGTVTAGTTITAYLSPTTATVSISQTVASASLTLGGGAWTFVDEIISDADPLSTGDVTQLQYNGVNPTTGPQIRFKAGGTIVHSEDGTGSLSLTGKRIAQIDVVAIVNNQSVHTVLAGMQLQIGGNPYSADNGLQSVPSNSGRVRIVGSFSRNPATGQAWTNADALNLTDGATDSFGLGINTKAGAGAFIVTTIMLQVTFCDEDRVATGFAFASDAANGSWATFATCSPADNSVANWSRTSAHDYLYVFTTAGTAPGTSSLVGVDDSGIAGAGLTGWQGADISLQSNTVPNRAPTYSTWVPALFHMTSAPALGADISPYAKVATQPVDMGTGHVRQGISSAHGSPGPTSYSGVSILLARPTVAPTQPLVIRIKRTSDDVQFGGDVTIQPGSVTYNANGFALITALAASVASLVAATPYYLDITSTTRTHESWQVCYCATDFSATTDGTTAAGGTISGSATLDGTANALADLMVNIHTVPPTPGGFTATALNVTQSPATPGGPIKLWYAHLDWTSTSLTTAFNYYEVQRLDDGVWNSIAFITDEAQSLFNDWECVRGVATSYRVRVVRNDGAASDWA